MQDVHWAAAGAFGLLMLAGPATAQTTGVDPACQVEEAAVVLSCVAQSNGRMRDCEVLGVTPPNCGFEEAALEASEGARVDRSGQRGVRAGQRVRFAVRYRPAEEGRPSQPGP
ncbi:hypothetical protein [Brevundimonas sp.]